MRACRQRPERGKVQLDDLVVHRVGVCGDGNKVRLPTLRLHKRARDLVRRENGGGGAQLGAHIRDGRALGDGERRTAFPAVFDDLPNAALDREAAQQFQNNVLGRDPRREAAGEVDAENVRHFDAVRAAAIATATSRPPAPKASMPMPPPVGVWLSEPIRVLPGAPKRSRCT